MVKNKIKTQNQTTKINNSHNNNNNSNNDKARSTHIERQDLLMMCGLTDRSQHVNLGKKGTEVGLHSFFNNMKSTC